MTKQMRRYLAAMFRQHPATTTRRLGGIAVGCALLAPVAHATEPHGPADAAQNTAADATPSRDQLHQQLMDRLARAATAESEGTCLSYVHIGSGSQNFVNSDTQSFEIPQGTESIGVSVWMMSEEWPTFTGVQSQFNDRITYSVSLNGTTLSSGQARVNDLHGVFGPGSVLNGETLRYAQNIPTQLITQNGPATLTINASGQNIGDGVLDSGVRAEICIGEVLEGVGDLGVTVRDADTFEPIDAADVSIAGPELTSALTDADGIALFAEVSAGTYDILVNAEGYVEGVESTLVEQQSSNAATVFLTPGGDAFVVDIKAEHVSNSQTAYFLNGVSFIETFRATIDWQGNEPGEVRFMYPGGTEIGDPVSGSNATYEASFDMGDFGVGGMLMVVAETADGEVSDPKTANVLVVRQPNVITIPGTWTAKKALGQVIYEADGFMESLLDFNLGADVQLSLGVPDFGPPGKSGDFQRFSLDFEPELEAMVSSDGQGVVTIGEVDLFEMKIGSRKYEFEPTVGVNISYSENGGLWQVAGGSLTAAGQAGVTFPSALIPSPIPGVFGKFGLTLGLSGMASGTFQPDSKPDTADLFATAEVALTGGLVGQLQLAPDPLSGSALVSAGIEGSLTGTTNWKYPDPVGLQSVALTADVALSASAFWGTVEVTYPILESSCLWSFPTPCPSTFGRFTNTTSVLMPDGLPFASHVDHMPAFGQPITLTLAQQDAVDQTGIVDTSAWANAQARVAAVDAQTLVAVWTGFDPARPELNGNVALASIYDGTAWSAPIVLDDDLTSDGWADAARLPDGRVLAVFEDEAVQRDPSAIDPADPQTVLDAIAAASAARELTSVIIDPNTGAVSERQTLTLNSDPDAEPRLVATPSGASLLWLRAPAAAPGATAPGAVEILAADHASGSWSSETVIVDGLIVRPEFDVAASAGDPVVVWSFDADADPATFDDLDIAAARRVAGTWQAPQVIVDGPEQDERPVLAARGNQLMLAWLRDIDVVTADLPASGPAGPATVAAAGVGFGAVQGLDLEFDAAGSPVLTWIDIDNDGTAAASLSQRVGDVWTTALPILGTGLLESAPQITVAGGSTYVLGTVRDVVPQGAGPNIAPASIVFARRTAGVELIAQPDSLVATPAVLVPGEPAQLAMTVRNAGDVAAPPIEVWFYEEGSSAPFQTAVIEAIAPGATATALATWTPPQGFESQDFLIVVDQTNQAPDPDRSNNNLLASLVAGTNLAVTDTNHIALPSGNVAVTVRVRNAGSVVIPASTVGLIEDASGAQVDAAPVATLQPGTSQDVVLIWPAGQPDSGSASATVLAEIVTGDAEADLSDNTATIVVSSDQPPVFNIPGDVNNDGDVTLDDLDLILAALGTTAGDPGFDPDADLFDDGRIDIDDFQLWYAFADLFNAGVLFTSAALDTGACCVGSGCSITSFAECVAAGGFWSGVGSTCEEAPCNQPGPCAAADIAAPFGVLDASDVDTFIIAFQTGDPVANVAGEPGQRVVLDLNDLDTFINAFLTGCN